jgi:acetyl-CoA synthetase
MSATTPLSTDPRSVDPPEPPRTTPYWERARRMLGVGVGAEPVNIASLIVDQHVEDGRGPETAITFVARDRDATETDVTWGELSEQSGRFAAVLRDLGLRRGERVFLLAGRIPALYVAALGTWKAGGVVSPLFAAFGPEPIRQRLELGDARVLVTTGALYRRKIEQLRKHLPSLTHVLVVDEPGSPPAGTMSMPALLAAAEPIAAAATTADDPALIHFTSGTTGTPKAAVHVHGAVVAHMATALDVFGLGPDDVFWCTADPGWVTGTSYGISAPLAAGAHMVVDEGELDAERWYRLLERHRVTVWYTAPTAVRMLMRAGAEVARRYDLSSLRVVASVGEPLSAEAVLWGEAAFGQLIRDTWWQTETGAIMIANSCHASVEPGSMGRPIGGVTIGLLACTDDGAVVRHDGRVVEVDDPDQIGMIAIRPGWPSMFREYLHAPDRYQAAFADGWYLSGDLARRDARGSFWFVGRADDVIKTAGHLIGPFEVERVLTEHPDVVGAGVYGVPDEVAGELIRAEIVLRPGVEPSEATLTDVMAHARRRLGAALAPRSIEPVAELPYTRSGKVMRRLLRARALGLPEGDTSTLETGVAETGGAR